MKIMNLLKNKRNIIKLVIKLPFINLDIFSYLNRGEIIPKRIYWKHF